MELQFILILATILYTSWKFGQVWISKRERSKRSDSIHGNDSRQIRVINPIGAKFLKVGVDD